MTDIPFVRSGRKRLENDNYQTVDPRCVKALISTIQISGKIVDCCAPNGSGILDELYNNGYHQLQGMQDAFPKYGTTHDWNIFNPPYARNIVDKIIHRQIERLVMGETTKGVACLLRTGFDHAKTRVDIFGNCVHYAGQIKMLFRPKWFLDTNTTPIHNYVWHIWKLDFGHSSQPKLWYW